MILDDLGIGRLVGSIRDAVIGIDLDTGRIVLWNTAAEDLFGYSTSEALGLTVDALVPERVKAAHRAPFVGGCLTSQGPCVDQQVIERSALRKSGEEILIELTVSPVDDPSFDGRFALAVARDITERKLAEAERARLLAKNQAARTQADLASRVNAQLAVTAIVAHRRLEALSEATRQIAESLTLEVILTTALDATRDLFAADRATICKVGDSGKFVCRSSFGRLPTYLDTACPSAMAHAVIDRAVTTRMPVLIEDTLDPREDETIARAGAAEGFRAVLAVPLLRHRVIGTLAAYYDQPRRYTRDEIQAAQTLANRLTIAIENARFYQAAQEAIRMRDELFVVVTHDLKNLLGGIKGRAQLLKRRVAKADAPNVELLGEGLTTIDTTVTKTIGQLNALLDVAVLQLGQPLDLDCCPVDLVALARRLTDEYQQTTDLHTIRFETAVPELVGEWDRARLERVLSNLLANAVKYSPEGGQIDVGVAVESESGGDRAVLTVRDQGLGIPAADLPQIFERFHRAGNVVGRIKGTGIGLSSARQIVEQHGGTISAESQEGVGSAFKVHLPKGSPPSLRSR